MKMCASVQAGEFIIWVPSMNVLCLSCPTMTYYLMSGLQVWLCSTISMGNRDISGNQRAVLARVRDWIQGSMRSLR